MTDTRAARPLRADAKRNRDAILTAAHEAFESEGALASLDAIALRAGVGNATLYRNFPTRDDLLAAVMAGKTSAVLADGDELAATRSPREALAEWLVLLTWQLRIWHDLPSCVVTVLDDNASPMKSTAEPLLDCTARLLDAAQAAGAARADVTADDVFELVTALSWGVDRFGNDAATARRKVELATAGVFVQP